MEEKKNEPKVYEVNAQGFMVPAAIVIAGIVIAGAIFVTNGKAPEVAANTNEAIANAEPQSVEEAIAAAPKAQISVDDDPVLGTKEVGKIAVVEFSDYECPFCKRFNDDSFEKIKSNYINSGNAFFVFRDLPLDFHQPAAGKEANAAECIQDQKGDSAYFGFHDLLFDNTRANGEGVTDKQLSEFAGLVGANVSQFETCVKNEQFSDEIEKDSSDAASVGINGTPGFVIGKYRDDGTVDGIVVTGAQPFNFFELAIKKAQEG